MSKQVLKNLLDVFDSSNELNSELIRVIKDDQVFANLLLLLGKSASKVKRKTKLTPGKLLHQELLLHFI